MEELLEKVAMLKESLNNTSEVKNIKDLNKKINKCTSLQEKIKKYQETKDEKLKEEIYSNSLYKKYKQAETELNILILHINKELKKINSKGKCGLWK